MKIQYLIAAVLCIGVCSETSIRAQDMDATLAGVATNLAVQIKDHGNKKVTVLDFTDLQGAQSELGRYIAEQLSVDLVMGKHDFAVLDRANLKSILAEHKLTAEGLVDPDNAKKLGQFAGVDALVIGNIIPMSSNVQLTVKIITTAAAGAGESIDSATCTSSKWAGASSTPYFSVLKKVARTSALASTTATS